RRLGDGFAQRGHADLGHVPCPSSVMPGLVRGIHALSRDAPKTWMAVTSASEATTFFERVFPAMTLLRSTQRLVEELPELGEVCRHQPGNGRPRCRPS